MTMDNLLKEALIKYISGVILVGLLLFVPAGTLKWNEGWLFMFVLFVPMFMAPITSRKETTYRRVSNIIQNNDTRLILVVGITIFSVWFFSTQAAIVEKYGSLVFFWEKNAHLLYGE